MTSEAAHAGAALVPQTLPTFSATTSLSAVRSAAVRSLADTPEMERVPLMVCDTLAGGEGGDGVDAVDEDGDDGALDADAGVVVDELDDVAGSGVLGVDGVEGVQPTWFNSNDLS